MTTQSTAYDELKKAFTDEQAMMLADILIRQIEESSKGMVSTNELELLKMETDKKLAEAQVEQLKVQKQTIIWLVSAIMTASGLIIAAIKWL